MPVTSAPLERVFLSSRKILDVDRCRLLPKNFFIFWLVLTTRPILIISIQGELSDTMPLNNAAKRKEGGQTYKN